jgi:hypothetical protein
MALSVTKAGASQHSLKYSYTGSGAFTTVVTAAQLIADCAAGPLKDLLQRANAGITTVTWGNLGTSKALSIYVTQNGTSGGGTSVGPFVSLAAGVPNELSTFLNSADGTVNGTIELRYHPSQVR